jgi:hypothetical protein
MESRQANPQCRRGRFTEPHANEQNRAEQWWSRLFGKLNKNTGGDAMRTLLYAVAVLALAATPAQAMSFNVETIDIKAINRLTYHVYASGEIVAGDTERLQKALAQVEQNREITVYLDSPGGLVVEGLKLGKLISEIKANTSVSRKNALPAECSSACVLTYLGGRYRFLLDQSQIGVHQFAIRSEKDVQIGDAIAISQTLAAEIVSFMKNSRVDTDFFRLMTSALPSSIFYVPHDELRKLRVVTDNVWDENWSFESAEGITYLKIWQQSSFGENKLLLLCPKGYLIGWFFTQEPEYQFRTYNVGIFINGDLENIPHELVIQPPRMEGRFMHTSFYIKPKLAGQMLTSNTIGAAIEPPNSGVFLGFQTSTARGLDKLNEMVMNCGRPKP